MKHLVFILALLITAPSITCIAQASFKQAFINMPLASESSPDLQLIGTTAPNPVLAGIGVLVIVSGIAILAPALYLLQEYPSRLSTLDAVFFTAFVSIVGIGGIVTGVVLFIIAN